MINFTQLLITSAMIICLCAIGFVHNNNNNVDNSTSKYLKAPKEREKHEPRFLTFNTEEDGDVTVDLEFAIPFLTIPVKKTINNAWNVYEKGFANINTGALILAGVVVFSTVVIFPFLLVLLSFFNKYVLKTPDKMNQRKDQIGQNNDNTWRIMTIIDQALIENNIDTTACMQRTMCWIAKNAHQKLSNNNGQAASSRDKIIDGLLTNDWLNQWIEGTAIQAAIQIGLQDQNCSVYFSNCKITRKTMQTFANKIIRFLQHGQ